MRDRHRTRPAPRTPVRRKLAAPKTTPKGWLPKARRTCSNGTPKKLLQRMLKAAGIVANEEARRQYQESVALVLKQPSYIFSHTVQSAKQQDEKISPEPEKPRVPKTEWKFTPPNPACRVRAMNNV